MENMKQGAFSWSELTTPDPKAAVAFYTKVFGWKPEVMHLGPMDYTVVKAGEVAIGGITTGQPEAPIAWTPYVTVDNIDETVKLAESLGAKVCFPPTDIPEVGRFAILRDPQGSGNRRHHLHKNVTRHADSFPGVHLPCRPYR